MGDSIKGLAGYHKKSQISTSLFNNQILTGKPLADKINCAFSSVAQYIVPLQLRPEFNKPEFVCKFIISEAEVYKKFCCLQPFKSPGPDDLPNCMDVQTVCTFSCFPVASIFNTSI